MIPSQMSVSVVGIWHSPQVEECKTHEPRQEAGLKGNSEKDQEPKLHGLINRAVTGDIQTKAVYDRAGMNRSPKIKDI